MATTRSGVDPALRDQIGDTRQKLRQVVQALKDVNISQKEIAARADWNESALSTLVGKSRTGKGDSSAVPNSAPEKMRALIRALYVMSDQRLPPEAHLAPRDFLQREMCLRRQPLVAHHV